MEYKGWDYTDWEKEPSEILWIVPTPCVFLQGGKCLIYPTRPDMCVGFRAGVDERCLQLRKG